MKQYGLILKPSIGYTFTDQTEADQLPFTDVVIVAGRFNERVKTDEGVTELYLNDQLIANYSHVTRVLVIDPNQTLGLLPHFNTHFLQGQIAYHARAVGFLKD